MTTTIDPLREPALEFAFEIRVEVTEDRHVGRGSDERLTFAPIVGGTVDGPQLRGEVLPGGGGPVSVSYWPHTGQDQRCCF